MPTPLLILSDSPSSKSGLGRIARELALRIHENMGDIYRVGCVGPGFDDRIFMPYPNYPLHEMKNWVVTELPEIWRCFAGEERGILLVIWDASRLLWLIDPAKYCKPAPHITNSDTFEKYANLRTFLQDKPFEIWTYSAIDAEGPNGKLSYLIREVLSKCDRVLAYSEWSARIIERTLGDKAIDALPHGIDTQVWRPRGRDKARRKFGQLVFDTDFSIKPNQFVIGIVGTNQARKDFGTAIAAAAELAKVQDVLLWIHTDTMERFWSISALLVDYGLQNQAVVTTGRLTDEQMTWAYSACDVTWGIGLGEGFGFPIYESLACGVPCIHGNYGGGAEWLPNELKIDPVAFRHEGTFNSMRPVYTPRQWAEKTLALIGASASLPPELNWNNLWPRWNAWLRKEQMYPTHATPEMVSKIRAEKSASSPGDLGKVGHVWLPELVNPSIDPAELNCGITAIGESDFRVYMRVENRRDLLDKAIASIPEFWPLLSVVDNSPDGMCEGLPSEITIMRGPVPLTFTQSHNWFYKDAKDKGAKFIIWMHTDAEAVNFGHLRLLDFVRTQCIGKRKWGLVWTNYDSLCALNLDMIAEVGGYDTVFPKYFCDNDHTRRMRLAGWETIDSSIDTKHIGSQSILSDPRAKFLNDVTFPLYQQYYMKKWGGPVDHETFTSPFDGRIK
jgi:glycosyltransferase involved in cell wall biosynthesis